MRAFMIWAVVTTVLAALCVAKPNVGRAVVALLFIAMALLVNVSLAVRDPQSFVSFADGAHFAPYREVALRVVAPAPAIFGLVVAAYELALALLMLLRGSAVRIGLAGAALFLIGIVPLGLEEAPNVILAGGLAYLLTRTFGATLPQLALAWLRRRAIASNAAPGAPRATVHRHEARR